MYVQTDPHLLFAEQPGVGFPMARHIEHALFTKLVFVYIMLI